MNDDVKPMSQVEMASGVPVLVTKVGPTPTLVGLDPTTGTVKWQRPLTSSGVVPGIALSFHVAKSGQVAYLAPASDGASSARLVVIDPRGGSSEVARSSMRVFLSYPNDCEEATGICLDVQDGGGGRPLRLAPGARDLVATAGPAASGRSSIGPGGLVRYQAADGTLRIARQVGEKRLWDRSETEVFGNGYSTNGGWKFEHDKKRGIFYGTVGADVISLDAFPASRSAVSFAVKEKSGEVVWRQAGADSFCDRDVNGKPDDPWLACIWTAGEVRVKDLTLTPTKMTYDIARLDPVTGRTLWRHPVGRMSDKSVENPTLDLTGSRAVIATVPGKSLRLDAVTGALRVATKADVGWRSKPVDIKTDNPWGEKSSTKRYGIVDQPVAGGKPTERVELPFPATVGARTKNLVIVALENGVRAYPAK
ncbi:MAG: hypothetical protein L0H96_07905 [Humibacillus sp.]|nr:hypothetical protein [Humibacillus sp.]MDN5776817.1 hypothetical protein [Humibacillus sp.]